MNKLHPFSGFCWWLWFSVSVWLLPLGYLQLAAALLPLALLLSDRDGRQRLGWLLRLLLPLALGLWLIHSQIIGYWLGHTNQWHWPWPATELWLQIACCLLAAQLWLRHCPIPKLVNALLSSRLPATLSYLLAAPLLLIDPIQRQLQQIRLAQLARGVPLDGNLWQRLTSLPMMLLPLLAGLLNGVSQRGAMLEMRGFRRLPQRSPWQAPADSSAQRRLRRLLLLAIPVQLAAALL
ncbi:energy-coupling factor transporter transmembrane component T [Ferrimonas senticii]|uniref:energy-coupling factor transporter transmembrane component T n=1 Tax=Ferrimonas senticii TaxID=394566 RepID=UPI00041C7B95|nr:energy-coupling factor transporter transmembrane component T [Ferrimonas senticii]